MQNNRIEIYQKAQAIIKINARIIHPKHKKRPTIKSFIFTPPLYKFASRF